MSSIPVPSSSDKAIESNALASVAQTIVATLGSLKITVTSFALAIFITLVGTLAQVGKDIWEVLGIYFHAWFPWIETSVFFPKSWAPEMTVGSASVWFSVACLVVGLTLALMSLANRATFGAASVMAAISAGLAIVLSVSAISFNGFYFPGGATVGAIMCVNLLAAHLTRYKIRAKGKTRTAGYAITAAGLMVTWAVITQGHNSDGFQGEPPFAWTTLWEWVKGGLSAIALGLIALGVLRSSSRKFTRPIVIASGVVLGLIALWLWAKGDAVYLGDSGMRVLWNLIMATFAGVVLLAGLIPLFGTRAGVILLHSGVGLMMFGQWFVSQYDVEEQMTMSEGQTINYGQDIRSVELAVIRRDSPEFDGKDDVFVIPLSTNGKQTRFATSEKISAAELPFDIELLEYMRSSTVRMKEADDDSPVDSGGNRPFKIVSSKAATGATGSSVDIASGYFRFADKDGGDDLGTFLLSQESLMMRGGRIRNFDTETVTLDGVAYDVQLRFKRNYKDYAMSLVDVRKDDYLGTNVPRNYSSQVKLVDAKRDIDQELTIWMNNPRRYAGETFYQSGWQQDVNGNEYTTLQVVRNQGWMIPYVSCMICFVGLSYHFGNVLTRFIDRRARRDQSDGDQEPKGGLSKYVIPFLVIACFLILAGRATKAPTTPDAELDLAAFGQLPLVYEGRVKPFDTLARNTLRVISDGETFKGVLPPQELKAKWSEVSEAIRKKYPKVTEEEVAPFVNGDVAGLIALVTEKTEADNYAVTKFIQGEMTERQPAVRWLLDLISGAPNARRHEVIRIYHPQVLDLMGLKRRKGYRYSLEELMVNMDKFEEQLGKIREAQKNEETLDLYQKKVVALGRKLDTIFLMHRAFSPPNFPELPTPEEFSKNHTLAMQKVAAYREAMLRQQRQFDSMQPPLAVAPIEDEEWEAYATSWPLQALAIRLLNQDPKPSFAALNAIILGYLDNDAKTFNKTVYDYQAQLLREPPDDLIPTESVINTAVTDKFGSFYAFEAFFNRASPFLLCCVTYLLAFVMLCVGFIKYNRVFNRAAYWTIACTFVIHTAALIARIYISGRPPVTNLYSSAVFIGWGIILLSLVLEFIFRNGLSSLAGATAGFSTLLIAQKLTGDGDTIKVLQAVLDTQFWLATHVVTITLGYSTTLLAGLFGVIYVMRGIFTNAITKQTGDELAKTTYGVLCFAIFFSFIGTVLGGLWADDSWGRFWGWDPKENGALIIVLWNALILHAKWDRMIGNRGLAVLSIAGNIVTAWSWFGVNELGEGLHSYGFTEGRLATLTWVVAGHLLLIVVGLLPLQWWSSYRTREPGAA